MLKENKNFRVFFDRKGYLSKFHMRDDKYKMNWVIDENYLSDMGYEGKDKLFGNFDLNINGETINSYDFIPEILEKKDIIEVNYQFSEVQVILTYDFSKKENITWEIELINTTDKKLKINSFGIWMSLAYIMFRDKNILQNIHNSAAVFSSISTNYTKINAVRRGNNGGNLGIYQVDGETLSIGTYCEYENLFFENVSPSLDGVLFHKLILAGGYPKDFKNKDWIYSKNTLNLQNQEKKKWSYVFSINHSLEEFYQKSIEFGHAKIEFEPLNILGQKSRIDIILPEKKNISKVELIYKDIEIKNHDVTKLLSKDEQSYFFEFVPKHLGEHKLVIQFTDGSEDFVVFNVMDKLEKVINERVEYICSSLYNGETGTVPYAFEPVSNQGESLGKLNLVLKKNLLGELVPEQVRKVEESAVRYVKEKWFIDGDLTRPRKLYGDFYRPMDFEYIGHLYFLLSEFDDQVLCLNKSIDYLEWAADVFNLRVNPDLHEDERGKEESQMLGIYFLYIQDLLKKLKNSPLQETYLTIKVLWEKIMDRVDKNSRTYAAAITEHFYDNAGFGPAAGALSDMKKQESAQRYGELLLANIGYSNDFRGQNPDRWWEALTYMIHSLWGGVTASAAYKVYEFLNDPEYLKASYRATAGILYCYDTHSTTTLSLEKGMAASTYAVAGPHLNRYDLSRERFGQATFFKDGGIFSKLFQNDTQTPDWDMGEELVAYLDGFGQKTFVIKEDNQLRVINGSLEDLGDEWKITSFAPYCREFILIQSGKDKQIIYSESSVLNIRK